MGHTCHQHFFIVLIHDMNTPAFFTAKDGHCELSRILHALAQDIEQLDIDSLEAASPLNVLDDDQQTVGYAFYQLGPTPPSSFPRPGELSMVVRSRSCSDPGAGLASALKHSSRALDKKDVAIRDDNEDPIGRIQWGENVLRRSHA